MRIEKDKNAIQNDSVLQVITKQRCFTVNRPHALSVLLFLYIVFNLMATLFGIWNTKPMKSYVEWMTSIVPSINKIVAISNEPGSAAFILATSWSFVPLGYFMMLCEAKWNAIDRLWPKNFKTMIMFISATIFLPLIMLFFFYCAPDPSTIGHFDRYGIAIRAIQESRYFMILYGSGIWLCGSSVLSFLTLEIYLCYTKIHKKSEVTK